MARSTVVALALLCFLAASEALVFSFQEKKVLLEFYNSQPSKSFTWDFSVPLCSQTGITCTDGSEGQLHVDSIDLQNMGLTGSFPESFTKLRRLRLIDLSDNQLSGTIPPGLLYMFYSLRSLRLQGNQLSGTIPNEIRGIQHLENLDLSNNQLIGSIPSDLVPPTLFSLDLSNNALSGSIPPLFYIATGLNFLSLAGNQLSGTISTKIGLFSSLSVLNLANNLFTGTIPTELGSLFLVDLRLSNNQFVGKIPTELTSAFLLNVLRLDNNKLTGPLPDFSQSFASEFFVMGTNKLCPFFDYSIFFASNDYPGSTDCSVCNEFSCLNGGSCTDLGAEFTCDCSGLSYSGDFCHQAICNPSCKNGGQCVSPGVCDCNGLGASGSRFLYSGPTCQTVARCPAVVEDNASWDSCRPPDDRMGKCQPGFSGRISRQCRPDGTWGPIVGACHAFASCPQNNSSNAVWPLTATNQIATGVCISGFSGNPKRHCNSNSEWDVNILKPCKRNSCSQEQIGNTVFPDAQSLQIVYAKCLNGTKGRVRRVCQADGSWENYTGSLCA